MWFNRENEELVKELSTNLDKGLSKQTAQERLTQNGKNELPKPKNKPWIVLILLALLDPLSIILIVAGISSVVIEKVISNEVHLIDFLVIISIVFLNAIIQTIQQVKARKSLAALEQMTVPKAVVIRDGEVFEIPTSELVTGDVVILEAGKYVPADLRIIQASNLQIDESALTGESVPVEKHAKIITENKLVLAEQHNMAFMSTFVTNGRAVGVVVANAVNSEIGKIAAGLAGAKQEKTPLQLRLAKLTKFVSIFALFLAVGVFLFFFFTDRPNWPVNLMTSVTIAIAVIPESLIVIVTVILSLSTKRMSKINVIVKKLDAVETLGSVNVICSDKTGTLTQNKMTVKKIIFNNITIDSEGYKYNNSLHDEHFINSLTLCNDAINEKNEKIGDPTEIALVDFTRRYTIKESEWRKKHKRISEIPFDSERKLMSTINVIGNSENVYTKGAIDELLKKCTKIYQNDKVVPLTAEIKTELLHAAKNLSLDALRVLAFAYKKFDGNKDNLEKDLIFLGAVGMIDPPRPEAITAIAAAHQAGIRVMMITGDHKDTALAIAKQLNLASSSANVISGAEIDELNDEELKNKFNDISIFARVNPEHKTRIVNCLQALNYVVSMTGDGVNDAPSLSKADIGVAMGITGTDVSKQAANIILQDDNFSTILKGVEEGRNVYQKIKRAIAFVISANIANVLAFLIISLTAGIKPFDSVNILWFNLIIETLLAVPIGFDSNDNRLMLDKPRNKKESFFTNSWITILFVALTTTLTVVGTFFIGREVFQDLDSAKMATILVMTCTPAIYVFALQLPNYRIKAHHKWGKVNYYLLGASLIALALNFMIIYTPGVNQIFLLSPSGEQYITVPTVSWQMTLVAMAMMTGPLLMLLAYDQIRKAIGR
ncbi:cation-translocating P-type ATPase [Spiroplasma chrysopicola]|uniref:Cation-transporting ATPase n=1 Tax=Spiroplasma chrysopicola DF-1 TaxID=1276227 RepID=R4U4T5_9MOLU|nr:cation-translocating P-type ATPase [Spiroplasma chrysopicola]AGM25573.1 cation-transporting ATPase [Spiroplasma chrysopicola DF-1]